MTATRTTDLRTGTTVWEARRLRGPASEPLRRDARTGVLVVGAGVSGALIAQALAEAGEDVMVIDRRGLAKGATAASTALLQYELDEPMIRLARKRGIEATRRIWRRSRLAVAAIGERARRLGIDADIHERCSLYLAGDRLDARDLEREWAERKRAGFEVELLSRRDLKDRFGLSRAAAILAFGNYEADPRRLALGFLKDAAARGARLHCPVELAGFESTARGVTARTREGLTIRARELVLATGYEMPEDVPADAHEIVSTWAIATRPQPRNLWPDHCLIWEASDPYLYARATTDGRIVCGGEDEDFADVATRDALLPRKTKALERKLARLMPWVDPRAEFAWTGSFGASRDGAPSIGRAPGLARVHACLGYGGNGTTFSMMAAQMIAADIGGRPDPDAELFAFQR
ncbi:MAG: FAD-binding oxidoreductase [Methylobacteriaceae bacterium]|nr:FAD-binding oxidoreductase [Methylobacteriaceae bacterium]